MTCDVDDVAAAIIKVCGPVEAMKLQKLAYYCQAWSLAIDGNALFEDEIQAWSYGPVVYRLFDQHRGRRRVAAWPSGETSRLEQRARDLIELVCHVYGGLDGDQLSRLTHNEEPWTHARSGQAPSARMTTEISQESMRDFYRKSTLGQRTVSDLRVGGLHALRANDALDEAAVKDEIRRIREEYRGRPSGHPAAGEKYLSGPRASRDQREEVPTVRDSRPVR